MQQQITSIQVPNHCFRMRPIINEIKAPMNNMGYIPQMTEPNYSQMPPTQGKDQVLPSMQYSQMVMPGQPQAMHQLPPMHQQQQHQPPGVHQQQQMVHQHQPLHHHQDQHQTPVPSSANIQVHFYFYR